MTGGQGKHHRTEKHIFQPDAEGHLPERPQGRDRRPGRASWAPAGRRRRRSSLAIAAGQRRGAGQRHAHAPAHAQGRPDEKAGVLHGKPPGRGHHPQHERPGQHTHIEHAADIPPRLRGQKAGDAVVDTYIQRFKIKTPSPVAKAQKPFRREPAKGHPGQVAGDQAGLHHLHTRSRVASTLAPKRKSRC